MSGIQSKPTTHVIKQENVTHNPEKNAVDRSRPQDDLDIRIRTQELQNGYSKYIQACKGKDGYNE